MKIAAFALVCLVAFASASSLDTILAREGAASDSFAAFQGFMAKFDRVYDSPSVMAERFAIFQENMREAAELNRAHPRTTFGVTRFSDMTRAEWEAEYTIAFPKSNIPAAKNLAAPKAKSVFAAPPNAVDWRPQLNPIKDQKACGSCWAFSAMSAAEGALVAAGQDNVDGSEQHLVDCDADSAGCNGGWMHTAVDVLGRDGIFRQEDYPYTASDGSCSASDHEAVATIAGVNVRCANLAFLPDDVRTDDNCNDDDTKIAVAENGAQSIAINANLMMSYQSGIIQADSSSCYEEGLNHGVDIVGYDEEDGLEYYIVRNSWGSRWGEEGYFRIETGTNACGIDIYQVEAVL